MLTEAALRIGAAQILFLDVPVYAAVSETVESLRMHPKIKVSYVEYCHDEYVKYRYIIVCPFFVEVF